MKISLPFPAKVLWPNGRTRNNKFKWAQEKAAHSDGWCSAKFDACGTLEDRSPPIPVHITVYPKAKGPLPDADNCIAACKHMLDGIAEAIGINDRDFAAPTVAFGPREARIEITLGPIQKEQLT